MEAHAHRLYECTYLRREAGSRDHLFPRQRDIFHHSTVALYAQCLVMLTSVHTLVAAGSALATVGIGIACHHQAWLQVLRHTCSHSLDHSSDLVTRNHGVQRHTVTSHEGIDV